MSVPALQPLPPPLLAPSWIRWRILGVTLGLAAALIVAECVWLRGRQQARKVAWANEQVQDKIAAGRVCMHEQRWDAAIRQLEDALDVESASNREEAAAVLAEARRRQAESLLEAAGIALAHRQTDDALRLLHTYLALPQAEHCDRALSLRDEIQRALSDDEAIRLLERLSDEALTVFSTKGQLTEDDGLHAAAGHALFLETLRRNVDKEVRKREARREVARLTEKRRAAEQAARIARLRDTPAFRGLTAFLAQTLEQSHAQHQLTDKQQAELAQLFKQLGVKDASEQQRLRADLLNSDEPSNLRDQVERKRAEVKRAYRDSSEGQAADRPLFDQLVDQEVNAFLKLLPSS